jgi:hypothetical protein
MATSNDDNRPALPLKYSGFRLEAIPDYQLVTLFRAIDDFIRRGYDGNIDPIGDAEHSAWNLIRDELVKRGHPEAVNAAAAPVGTPGHNAASQHAVAKQQAEPAPYSRTFTPIIDATREPEPAMPVGPKARARVLAKQRAKERPQYGGVDLGTVDFYGPVFSPREAARAKAAAKALQAAAKSDPLMWRCMVTYD